MVFGRHPWHLIRWINLEYSVPHHLLPWNHLLVVFHQPVVAFLYQTTCYIVKNTIAAPWFCYVRVKRINVKLGSEAACRAAFRPFALE